MKKLPIIVLIVTILLSCVKEDDNLEETRIYNATFELLEAFDCESNKVVSIITNRLEVTESERVSLIKIECDSGTILSSQSIYLNAKVVYIDKEGLEFIYNNFTTSLLTEEEVEQYIKQN